MAGTTTSTASGRSGRRGDLLQAAAVRFVRQGIGATTMEQVAQDAGAGKATLYRHFANKDAVVDALLEREARRLGAAVDAAVAGEQVGRHLEVAVAATLDFLLEHPFLTRSRDREPAVLLPRVTAPGGPFVRESMARLTRLVEDGIAAGRVREVAPAAAAEVLLRVALSYFTLPPVAVDLTTAAQRRAFAHDLVAVGLGATTR